MLKFVALFLLLPACLLAQGQGGSMHTGPISGGGGGGGSGDVVGPSSSTDNAVVRYDGVTGKLVQDSNVIVDDTGGISNNVGSVVVSDNFGVTGNVTVDGTSVGVYVYESTVKAMDIYDSVGASAVCQPTVTMYPSGSALVQALIKAVVPVAEDSGTLPAISIQAYEDDDSALDTRPVFGVRNYSGACLRVNAAGTVTFYYPTLGANGAVGAPSYSFLNDADTGIYYANEGSSTLDVAIDGAKKLQVAGTYAWVGGNLGATGNVSFTGVELAGNGSVSAPAYSFSGDTDTGWYWLNPGSPTLCAAIGGTIEMQIDGSYVWVGGGLGATGNVTTTGVLRTTGGTAAVPAHSFNGDSDTGWYRVNEGSSTLNGSIDGTKRFQLSSSYGWIGGNLGVTGNVTGTGNLTISPDGTNAELTVSDGQTVIGESAAAGQVTIAGATADTVTIAGPSGGLASGKHALAVSATLPNSATNTAGTYISVTSAGTGAGRQYAMDLLLNSGYTGAAKTFGVQCINSAAGTDDNFGCTMNANGSGATNIGTQNHALGGSTLNIGNLCISSDSAAGDDVTICALNAGTGGYQVAGYFALNSTRPSPSEDAVIAGVDDDGDQILIVREMAGSDEGQLVTDNVSCTTQTWTAVPKEGGGTDTLDIRIGSDGTPEWSTDEGATWTDF